MLLARNSNLTKKPKVNSALIYQPRPQGVSHPTYFLREKPWGRGCSFTPPSPSLLSSLSISAPFYGYLKLHGKGRSRKKDLWSHLRMEFGTSRTEGRPLTICPNPKTHVLSPLV